jgi:hypothetical protein
MVLENEKSAMDPAARVARTYKTPSLIITLYSSSLHV